MVSSFIPKVAADRLTDNVQTLMVTLPQIIEYRHDASEEFPREFTELAFRNEGFRPVPFVSATPVLHQELLETTGSYQGEWK
jgi:hypothetical protein